MIARWMGLAALVAVPALAQQSVTVYKDAGCACCGKWAAHLRDNGFTVQEVAVPAMASVKRQLGVPAELASCHTARIGNYIIEGHVPAADVRRLLAERPPLAGLAVPGMPQGAPGMEGPGAPQPYAVVGFDAQGASTPYARH